MINNKWSDKLTSRIDGGNEWASFDENLDDVSSCINGDASLSLLYTLPLSLLLLPFPLFDVLLMLGWLCNECDGAFDLLEVSRCDCWMAAMEALTMVPCKRANSEGPQFDACTTAASNHNKDNEEDSGV